MESRKYRILAIGTSAPPLMEKENINSTKLKGKIICLIDGVCVKLEDLGTFEPRQRAERKHPHNAILGGNRIVLNIAIPAYKNLV